MDSPRTKDEREDIVHVDYFILIFTRMELSDYLRNRKLINTFVIDFWNKRIMMKELINTGEAAYSPRFIMKTGFAVFVAANVNSRWFLIVYNFREGNIDVFDSVHKEERGDSE